MRATRSSSSTTTRRGYRDNLTERAVSTIVEDTIEDPDVVAERSSVQADFVVHAAAAYKDPTRGAPTCSPMRSAP